MKDITNVRPSEKDTAIHIPVKPKKMGKMKIMDISKTNVLEIEIRAEITPLLRPVKNAEI